MTTYYTLEAAFSYQATSAEDPALGDWLDDVMVHLEDLGVEDVMMVSDNEASSFVVSLLVGAESGDMPENVVGKGMSSLRTAFHACDASTTTWPSPREALLIYANLTVAGSTTDDKVSERESELAPA